MLEGVSKDVECMIGTGMPPMLGIDENVVFCPCPDGEPGAD